MDKRSSNSGLHATLRMVFLGIMMVLVAAVCQTSNGSAPAPEPEKPPTEVLVPLVPAQVRRELPEVYAGAGDEDELPRLKDGDWHDLSPQGWVVTDEEGEGWLDIQIEDQECLRVYVFQSSKLIKAACPKSAYEGGNVACSLEGTHAFNNSCASQVVIETPSTEIRLKGTWLSVTHLADRELSLIIVLEGQARVLPVLDPQSRALGDEVVVAENQFLFSMPDASLAFVGDLIPRQAYSIAELPAILDELELRLWIYRIRGQSEADIGAQLNVPPKIHALDFPDQIPADTDEDNPVPWTIEFSDLDGDVSLAELEVIDQNVEAGGGSFEAEEVIISPDRIAEGDEREGVLQLAASCKQNAGVGNYRLTLIDEAGHRSLPAEFTFNCVPSSPTPSPTPTDTPTSTVTPSHTPTPTPTPTQTPTPTPTRTRTPTSTPAPFGQIMFSSSRSGDRELYTMNANGSGLTRMTFTNGDDSRSGWSNNGQWITFASSRDGDWEIYYMENTPDGNTFQLTNNANVNEFDPDWHPNGGLIVFDSNRDGDYEIFTTTTDIIDGPDVTQLTFNSASDGCPRWSPNGQRIAFSSDRNGNREIYVMNADGSGQTRLTNHPALDNCPTWSPDGRTLAFRSDRDGDAEIWLMDADGSNQRQLTRNSVPDWGPAPWSPDGRWIVFHSNRGGSWEIVIISVDGQVEINLTNHSAYDAYPNWR